jgi:glycolate oxidase iron-sulfur subunit
MFNRFVGMELKISDDLLTQCMHCGLCLPVCPTYALTGLEKNSPRGRIRLMKSVMSARGGSAFGGDDSLPVTKAFMDEMYFCLDCQACQTACPAGVKYGELVESARAIVEKKKRIRIKIFILRNIVERMKVLNALAIIMKLYQNSFLEKIVLKLLKRFLPSMYSRAKLMPRLSDSSAFRTIPEVSEPDGSSRGTVAVLTGCVMDVFYSDVNRDTVDVLLVNGWRVVIPQSQVCCGSLGGHNGDAEYSKGLAKKNIAAFERSGADYYVINSAGCCAFLKKYGELLSDDPEYSERAKRFVSKVRDFSEFVYQTGFKKPERRLTEPAVYHEACHLVHSQKISEEPRSIVREIAGDNFRELDEATWCCGSAGIYNVLRYDDASKLLDRKVDNIKRSGAHMVITGNPGCLAQIDSGIKKEGLDIEVLHPATVLNRLYKESSKQISNSKGQVPKE